MLNMSPLDGRYREMVAPLMPYLSEVAFYRYRALVEVEWLIHQARHPQLIHVAPISVSEEESLRTILENFKIDELQQIEGRVGHDVKAIEYYLRDKLRGIGLARLVPALHFGCTSEDISSTAYSLMLKEAVREVLVPEVVRLSDDLRELAERYREVVVLGITHGQSAVPTTLGKEFAVFVARIDRQATALAESELFAKFSGAVGSYNAHVLAYPDVDWQATCREFVESLGIQHSPLATQVDSRDSLAETMHKVARLNAVIEDLVRDIWLYGALSYLKFSRSSTEVGSSTMPQKTNPIDFENAEANSRMSLALLNHLSEALTVSRLQRDLSDSSAARNIAVALGHFLVAVRSTRRGLAKLSINEPYIETHLDERWDVLTEGAQTLLRKAGVSDAYEQVVAAEQSGSLDKEALLGLLGQAMSEDRERFSSLEPSDYRGLSSELVDQIQPR